MNRLLILFGFLWLACSPTVEMLSDPDPGLADLAITDVFPPTILPASLLVIRGRSLPDPVTDRFTCGFLARASCQGTVPRSLDVRLRAEYVSAQEAGCELIPKCCKRWAETVLSFPVTPKLSSRA